MVGCSQSLSFDSFSKVRGCTRVTRRFGRFGLLYRLLSMFSCWNSRTLIGPPVFSSGFEDAGARTSAFNTQPPTDCTQPTTSAGAAAASAHETASIPPRLCKCSQKATGLKSSVPTGRSLPPTHHSTQPDHCSAGAGSTGQSKQRAGSGPSQSVSSAKRALILRASSVNELVCSTES